MSLKSPIYHEFNLDNMVGNSKPIRITHIDDTNVDVLELCVRQGGSKIDLTGATVTARIVLHAKRDYLINDNVPCTVNDSGNVLIPFDNAVIESQKGVLKIEVNIRRAEDVLTLQFPLWVMVNDTILAAAEVLPESEGTIPELLEAAQEALDAAAAALEDAGDYSKLDNKPQINGHTLSGDKTSSELGLQDKLTAGDNVTIDENGVISAEGGGSQIVSGIVNANGTITFTDSDGNTFTTTGLSVIGADGVGIADVHIDGGGDLIIETTDGHMENVGHVVGADGQDYVLTPQDKSDIADIVLNELPTTQGVLYGD